MNYKVVAERMKKIRKEKNIKFWQLEQETGLKCFVIARLLSGTRAPRLSEFALLCIALGVSADELLQTDEKWEVLER